MAKNAAIVQSSYIPWKGYFDLIASVDEFILYDNVQYTRCDWRNRNRIKTEHGLQWLSIPVLRKGKFHQRIDETEVCNAAWARSHWSRLQRAYAHAPFFEHYAEDVSDLYRQASELHRLSQINHLFITTICRWLNISTRITRDTDYQLTTGKSERLLHLCKQAGAGVYLSGPAARDYLDVPLFEAAGIRVEWADYSGYRQYPQLYGPFEHQVTVLDLLFNTGTEAQHYLKSCKRELKMFDSPSPG